MLEVRNLCIDFDTEDGRARAVEGVGFEIREGETLALVGESGCGKSVTSLAIIGLVPRPPGRITAGEVVYGGRDLLRLPRHELHRIRGNEISMIFQEPMTSLNPVFTIGDQIGEAARCIAARGAGKRWRRRARCWVSSRSRIPIGLPAPTRTSSRAGCSSGR